MRERTPPKKNCVIPTPFESEQGGKGHAASCFKSRTTAFAASIFPITPCSSVRDNSILTSSTVESGFLILSDKCNIGSCKSANMSEATAIFTFQSKSSSCALAMLLVSANNASRISPLRASNVSTTKVATAASTPASSNPSAIFGSCNPPYCFITADKLVTKLLQSDGDHVLSKSVTLGCAPRQIPSTTACKSFTANSAEHAERCAMPSAFIFLPFPFPLQ